MIKLSFNNSEVNNLDLTAERFYAVPMVVRRKFDGEIQVVLTSYDGVIYFLEGDYITFSDKDHLKDNFEFVRFLDKDEAVTFTGER